ARRVPRPGGGAGEGRRVCDPGVGRRARRSRRGGLHDRRRAAGRRARRAARGPRHRAVERRAVTAVQTGALERRGLAMATTALLIGIFAVGSEALVISPLLADIAGDLGVTIERAGLAGGIYRRARRIPP